MEHKDIQPLIYISKLDLLEDVSEYEQFKKNYETIGYQVFFDWKELTEVLADKVTVFMGQTGAGKTTLLNLIAPV